MRYKASRFGIQFIVGVIAVVFMAIVGAKNTLAASTTMQLYPKSGDYDNEFTIDLEIDGHGDIFNAAEANVLVSPELKIKDIILGDCNFSFLSTPSIVEPSFKGVALGDSLEKCTVYSLSLIPVANGDASITLENAAVRRYGDAADILTSISSANFSVITAPDSESLFDISKLEEPEEGLYTVLLRTYSDSGPEPMAQIKLTNVDSKNVYEGTTDQTGNAKFENIESGIYTIAITKDDQEFLDNILNVSGNNHILSLGIKLREKPIEPEQQSLSSAVKNLNIFIISGLAVVITVLVGIIIKNKQRQ